MPDYLVSEAAMEEYKLNGTDRTVIRQLSLLNLFLQYPNGLSFEKINNLLYANYDSGSMESRKRMFHRDRDTLEDAIGFYTFYNEKSKLYEVDSEKTIVSDKLPLSKEERKVIRDVTLPHLLESYADQSDLILALNKIGVDLSHSRTILPSDADKIDFLKGSLGIKYVIWNCYINRKTCKIRYITAEGNLRSYTAQIYGTFSVSDNQYLVANVGENDTEDIRTLRYDRIEEIEPLKGSRHYGIPDDYQDYKYLKLPFQIGPRIYRAKVLIDSTQLEEFASLYRMKGATMILPNGDVEWDIDVSNEDVFLFWLIAHGYIPLAPANLKQEFIARLERVIHDEEK